jgi:hypothetical protein
VSAPPPSDSRYTQAWINTDRHPIGQLTAIDSTMVGLVVHDSELLVVGIDPTTGHELWHRPATPGAVTPGVVVHIAKVGANKVAYFRPVAHPNFAAQLVVADARSGRDLAVSPPAWFTAYPFACMNDQDACVLSADPSIGKVHAFRLEVTTGKYLVDSPDLPLNARLLDEPGMIDLGDRPGNTLGWLRDGKLQWSVPVSAAFPPGFSSDNGWTWHLFTEQHVVVGSVYGRPLAISPRYVLDLERAATAGLSEETGEVRWRDLGSSLQCHLGKYEYPVRCRQRGIGAWQHGHPASFDGVDVTVEGYDPVTGATTWSVPMGPAVSLADSSVSIPIAGPTETVVDRPAGPIVLDYATGNVTPLRDGATFWCMTAAQYELALGYRTQDGKQRHDRPGGDLAAICDAWGNRSDALPSLDATMAAGAHVGSRIVVATPNGYIGYLVR